MPYRSEDSSSEDGDVSDEEELAAALALQREGEGGDDEERAAIYNVDAIHDKLEDMAWAQQQAWEETLAVTSTAPTTVENVDDDLERELAFYNQALGAAQTAVQRYQEGGTPWQRPPDYYAEMVKSDDHMARVKEQLLYEQHQIEGAEQRRKDREAKRFAKQTAAERKAQRAKEKKTAITSVSALRKQRQKTGFADDLDMDSELVKMEGRAKSARDKSALGDRFQAKATSTKRTARNSKYGFGGPKRLGKQNDAYSAAAVDGYKPGSYDDGIARRGGRGGSRGGGSGRGGGRGRGGGGGRGGSSGRGGKAQRPGKERRRSMK